MERDEYARMFSLEEDYWWYRALRRNLRRALRRAGPLSAPGTPATCLDAGCGTGMLLQTLSSEMKAVGVDASASALALARRRGLTRLARAGVEALPLRDASCDVVISADVLYHRGVGDDVAALREAARCLRPGGVLVLNLPAFGRLRSSHDAAIHTARRYTAAEVRRKLRAAGLAPLRVRYWNSLLFLPLASVRLLRRRASARAPGSDLTPLPRWMNSSLRALLALETALDFVPWPAGLSVMAVARKETRGAGRGENREA